MMHSLGFGIFATQEFEKEAFLLEYPGDLILEKDADIREAQYEKEGKGCYMYYFVEGKEQYW